VSLCIAEVEINGYTYRVYDDGFFWDGRGLRHLPDGWLERFLLREGPEEVDTVNRSRVGAQCRDCGRSVLWLKHERTGNLAPINDTPSPDGNVLINEEAGTWRVVATHTEQAEYVGRLHKHHRATCSKARRK
jgi:hypothetical protein